MFLSRGQLLAKIGREKYRQGCHNDDDNIRKSTGRKKSLQGTTRLPTTTTSVLPENVTTSTCKPGELGVSVFPASGELHVDSSYEINECVESAQPKRLV
jgi:hypothetical protein